MMSRRYFAPMGVALVVALTTSSGARADNIDDELAKRAPEIMKALKSRNVTTVGVLKFRVAKGKDAPTFTAGPMNSNMVTRLENLLVLSCDSKAPIRLLANPGEVIASKKAKLSYLNEAGRAELFKIDYPIVGQKEPGKADGFLIGEVELPSPEKTVVKIRVFTAEKLRPELALEFTVNTDRAILSDVGLTSIIAPREFKKGDLDGAAIRGIKKNDLAPWNPMSNGGGSETTKVPPDNKGPDNGKGTDPGPGPTVPVTNVDLKNYVDFRVLYNGEEQKLIVDPKTKKERLPEPAADTLITMKVKNISDHRIGVVLAINGTSTIFSERGEWRNLRKWVLDTKEEYTIGGFYQKDEKVAPFKVAKDVADEPMAKDSMGMIQLAVFDPTPEKEKKISIQGISDTESRQRQVRSFEELNANTKRSTNLKRNERGFIVPNLEASAQPMGILKEVPFEGTQLGIVSLSYLAPDSGDDKPKDKDDKKEDKKKEEKKDDKKPDDKKLDDKKPKDDKKAKKEGDK